MAMVESTWLALLSRLAKSAKRFCALEDVKILVSKLGSGSGECGAHMAHSFAVAHDQVFYMYF